MAAGDNPIPGKVLTFKAGAAITKGQLVYLSAADTVSPCDATNVNPIGVALMSKAINAEDVPVLVGGGGVVYVTALGAVTQGQTVVGDADGKAAASAAGDELLNLMVAIDAGTDAVIRILVR